MHPMRQFIRLAEARKPKQSYQEQQAARLATLKAEATGVLAQHGRVMDEITRAEYDFRKLDNEWVGELRKAVQARHQAALASAKEEHEYDRETNPDAQMRSVDFGDALAEGLAAWWDDKKAAIEWQDGKHRLEDYYDSHNKTEQSDDMSRLDAESTMLRHIEFAGFGSFGEMAKTLTEISRYLDVMQNHMDGGWSHPGQAAIEIITKGLPVIGAFSRAIVNLK